MSLSIELSNDDVLKDQLLEIDTNDIKNIDDTNNTNDIDDTNDDQWLIVKDDPKKYNDLIKEVEYLKLMVIDMHKLMVVQNENVNRLGDTVDKMNENVSIYSRGILKESSDTYAYIKTYLFPALKLAGTYTPLIMLLTTKTGLASSTISFIFRIFNL